MKVYVAGKWQDREIIQEVHKNLRAAGHEITCDWTDHEYPIENVDAMLRHYAEADIQGVKDAQLVVCWFVQKHHYRGALVELGAALALGKPVAVIGKAEESCIFMRHPNVRQFKDLGALLKAMGLDEVKE